MVSDDRQSVLAVYDGVRRVDLKFKNEEMVAEMLRHAGKHRWKDSGENVGCIKE